MTMKSPRIIGLLLALLLATPVFSGTGRVLKVPKPVPGKYIVVLDESFHPNVPSLASELARAHRGKIEFQWEGVIKGFSIVLPEAAASALSLDRRVKFVEEVAEVELSVSEPTAQWNLDRLDQPGGTGRDNLYTYCSTGNAVPIYIVDTGVRGDHDQFGGRVQAGADFADDPQFAATNPCGMQTGGVCPGDDPNCYWGGHGTSVASIAAGRDFGVAKSARIVPVKVLNCFATGTSDRVINGLDWIYNYHLNGRPGVVNMSIFYQFNNPFYNCEATSPLLLDGPALDAAVNNLIANRGLTVVVSANNRNRDARCTTPARVEGAITVAGSTEDNRRWTQNSANDPGSNYGPAVDIFAPAAFINSAGIPV